MKGNRNGGGTAARDIPAAYISSIIGNTLSGGNYYEVIPVAEANKKKFEKQKNNEQLKLDNWGEVPQSTDSILTLDTERNFVYKVSLANYELVDGRLEKQRVNNIENFIVTSLLAGDISHSTGINFLDAVAKKDGYNYKLYRNKSDITRRHFYSDPQKMGEALELAIEQAEEIGFKVDRQKIDQELKKARGLKGEVAKRFEYEYGYEDDTLLGSGCVLTQNRAKIHLDGVEQPQVNYNGIKHYLEAYKKNFEQQLEVASQISTTKKQIISKDKIVNKPAEPALPIIDVNNLEAMALKGEKIKPGKFRESTGTEYKISDLTATDVVTYAYLRNNRLRQDGAELRTIGGKDPVKWLIENEQIKEWEGKEKYKWIIESDSPHFTIDGKLPLVWFINNNKEIDGKTAVEWIKANPMHKQVIEFYEHIITSNEFIELEGKKPIAWLLEKEMQPRGIDLLDYLNEPKQVNLRNGKKIENWLSEQGLDYEAIKEKHDDKKRAEEVIRRNSLIEEQVKEGKEGRIGGMNAVIYAAYNDKQDLLIRTAKGMNNTVILEILAEEYHNVKLDKNLSEKEKKERRNKLEEVYNNVAREAFEGQQFGKDSLFGKMLFSNSMSDVVKSFTYVSKNELRDSIKPIVTGSFKAENILKNYSLPVIEKAYEVGQKISEKAQEKPKGLLGFIQKCCDWIASLFNKVDKKVFTNVKKELDGLGGEIKKNSVHTKHQDEVAESRRKAEVGRGAPAA